MTQIAETITFTRRKDKTTVEVDGKEFPWFIDPSAIVIDFDPLGIPTVTLRLLAHHVVTDNEI